VRMEDPGNTTFFREYAGKAIFYLGCFSLMYSFYWLYRLELSRPMEYVEGSKFIYSYRGVRGETYYSASDVIEALIRFLVPPVVSVFGLFLDNKLATKWKLIRFVHSDTTKGH